MPIELPVAYRNGLFSGHYDGRLDVPVEDVVDGHVTPHLEVLTEPAGQATPSWLVIAALESAMPDGSVCWDIARAHLTNATATRLAYATPQDASQELKEATGGAACYALALALEVNLYGFAGECWAAMSAEAMAEAA